MTARSAGFTPLPPLWIGDLSDSDLCELGHTLKQEALLLREAGLKLNDSWQSRRLATGEIVSAFVGENGLEYFITKRVDQLTKLAGASAFIADAHRMAGYFGAGSWTDSSANAELMIDGAKVKVIIVRYGAPYQKASQRIPVPTPPAPAVRGGR